MLLFKQPLGDQGKKITLSMLYLSETLYFDYYFGWLLYLLELFIFIYKGSSLFYTAFAGEIVFVLIMWAVHFVRTWLGSSGNKGQSNWKLILFLVLCVGEIAGFVFFLRFQSYTYYLEIGIFSLGTVFIAVGFVLGLANVIIFNLS